MAGTEQLTVKLDIQGVEPVRELINACGDWATYAMTKESLAPAEQALLDKLMRIAGAAPQPQTVKIGSGGRTP